MNTDMDTDTAAAAPEALKGTNDIENLARAVAGFDAARYFDRQAEDAARDAARRWPILAAMLAAEIRY